VASTILVPNINVMTYLLTYLKFGLTVTKGRDEWVTEKFHRIRKTVTDTSSSFTHQAVLHMQ